MTPSARAALMDLAEKVSAMREAMKGNGDVSWNYAEGFMSACRNINKTIVAELDKK